ncbi:phosphotransferase family protein [Jeotgalibacillus sp. R-1-5s-1]|uniref:phosphotransferase family protein n=1 Tax=Jeotgalibacillus sp. R-1-5s-1 TaxID=2555897 RepID=UPI001069AE14|nr:aminoglycoside phosphotransferase family protein [Jeotgalibacillus sp. R-1-5s-1]TFD94432.1 aminoglycoside phosphotransferase family protein [Jeotgalibacillus sp. R-1-5s-1]
MILNKIIKHFGLQTQSISDVADSHSSTVYKVLLTNGETVYIKIPFNILKFHREIKAYSILEGRIAVPRLLDVWEGDDETIGALLLSELEGQPLKPKLSTLLAYETGVYHASMHAIQPPQGMDLTNIDNEFPNWTAFLDRMFYGFAEDTKKVIDPFLYEAAIQKYVEMKNDLPAPDGPSFIHMDFRPANILVKDERVMGAIDFESVRFGATEMDFSKIHRDFLSLDPSLYQAYQDGYRSIRPLIDLDQVLIFYRFTDAFNSIGWCQRRGIDQNRDFYEQNLGILKEELNVYK